MIFNFFKDNDSGMKKKEHKENSKDIKGSAQMFSGCLDEQCSADAQFRQQNQYKNNGAFTYMLLKTIEEGDKFLTNKEVLISIYEKLKSEGFPQVPQFSCSAAKILDDLFIL